jgi:antitoxin ParD1/3/4
MTIKLNPDLEAYVEQKIREGRFPSAQAAIEDAVRQAKEREEQLESLKREVRLGLDELDRGEGEPWNVDEIKERLYRKHGRP